MTPREYSNFTCEIKNSYISTVEKFEILVKPDPALDFKLVKPEKKTLGKKKGYF